MKGTTLQFNPSFDEDEGWLAIKFCGFETCNEARDGCALVQDALLMRAVKQKVGVNVGNVVVFPTGSLDLMDPGAPLPIPLNAHELVDMVSAAVESPSALTENQKVAAETAERLVF
jgi:hypothetical protein